MNINDIMEVVHQAYPDGFTREYWNTKKSRPKRGSGDTLAAFVVIEVAEVISEHDTDEDKLLSAMRALDTASRELDGVVCALRKKLQDVEEGTKLLSKMEASGEKGKGKAKAV